MLYMQKTRIEYSVELPVSVTLPTILEGMLLKSAMESGVAGLLPSTATATPLAGIALKYMQTPTVATAVESVTVPAGGGNVTLKNTPLTPSTATSAYIIASSTSLAYNGAVGAGQYAISGAVISFNAAQAGAVVTVIYTYTLTAAIAQLLYGDNSYAGATQPSAITGTVGVIKRGTVYTDQFDPAVNWFATSITMAAGANGTITIGGSGTVIPGTVVEAPTPDQPFLGFTINVG